MPNAYDDPRFDRRFDKQIGYTTRSMLVVPITSLQTQDVLGCLQCLNKQTFDGIDEGIIFEQSDIELATAFAEIAAIAVVQSKLEQASEYGVGMAIKTRTKASADGGQEAH